MDERINYLHGLKEAVLSTDSIMEGTTVLATCMLVPGAIKVPEIVAVASLMGGNLDDCFDKSNREQAIELVQDGNEWMVRKIANKDLWEKYVTSWKDLIETVGRSTPNEAERERVIKNSVTFFRNIRSIEMQVLKKDIKDWSLEEALDYRKAVCAMWAEYFVSLSAENGLDLELVESPEPKDVLESRRQLMMDNKAVSDLYHGSVVYQLVADWTGREYNLKKNIPGLGSLGATDINKSEAWEIIEENIATAKKAGAIGNVEAAVFRWVFPLVRNIANARLAKD